MNSVVKKWEKDAYPRKQWSKILTNKMTIIGWRLYGKDRALHFAFVLYRLKKDLGFTEFELANFTGMPVDHVNKFMKRMRPILESNILNEMAKVQWEEDEHAWRSIPAFGLPQGYYIVKDQSWYDRGLKPMKVKGEPAIRLGRESEKEWEQKLKEQDAEKE